MQLTRYLKPEQILLDVKPRITQNITELSPNKRLWLVKESVLKQLVECLDRSGKVGNKAKLYTDLLNREKKASTAIGGGIAIPHVRTMQAKQCTMAFARSIDGVEFDSPDGMAIHVIFAVIGPPYEDAFYLKVYKHIADLLLRDGMKKKLMAAQDEHELIKLLSSGR